jgi:hypothetical protein
MAPDSREEMIPTQQQNTTLDHVAHVAFFHPRRNFPKTIAAAKKCTMPMQRGKRPYEANDSFEI